MPEYKRRHACFISLRISRVFQFLRFSSNQRGSTDTDTRSQRALIDNPISRRRDDATPLQVQVSIRRIQYEKAWAKVEEMQAEDVVFEGPIIAVNRGGAIVLVEVRQRLRHGEFLFYVMAGVEVMRLLLRH